MSAMTTNEPSLIVEVGPNEYRCYSCKEVFIKGWSDEEAAAERAEKFPGVAQDDCDLVCDDCFKAMGFAAEDTHEAAIEYLEGT